MEGAKKEGALGFAKGMGSGPKPRNPRQFDSIDSSLKEGEFDRQV